MIEPRNQQDIVNNFLRKTEAGKVVEDILEIPHLAKCFNTPSGAAEVSIEQIRYPGAKEMRPGRDAAIMFVTTIGERQSVTKIIWTPGADFITVHFAYGFEQKSSMSDDALVGVLTNIMKSRVNVTRIEWELASGEIEIAYVNPSQY